MQNNSNKIIAKVYIDGSNVFHAQKKLGWFVDWQKVREQLERGYEVLEWRYYIGVKNDDSAMAGFLRYLNAVGIKTVTKPLKKIALNSVNGETGERYMYKANFDVEITTDILLETGKTKEIVLFSGDSDFAYLIKRLKDLGKKVTIFSSRKTISWELKLMAAKVVYIESLKEKLKRS